MKAPAAAAAAAAEAEVGIPVVAEMAARAAAGCWGCMAG